MFQEFSRAMRQCSLAFFLVSASNIILTISQVHLLILPLGCIGLMHFQFLPYASTLQCRSPVMIQSQFTCHVPLSSNALQTMSNPIQEAWLVCRQGHRFCTSR